MVGNTDKFILVSILHSQSVEIGRTNRRTSKTDGKDVHCYKKGDLGSGGVHLSLPETKQKIGISFEYYHMATGNTTAISCHNAPGRTSLAYYLFRAQ